MSKGHFMVVLLLFLYYILWINIKREHIFPIDNTIFYLIGILFHHSYNWICWCCLPWTTHYLFYRFNVHGSLIWINGLHNSRPIGLNNIFPLFNLSMASLSYAHWFPKNFVLGSFWSIILVAMKFTNVLNPMRLTTTFTISW